SVVCLQPSTALFPYTTLFRTRVMLIGAALAVGAGVHGLVWVRAGANVVTTIVLGAAAFNALKPHLWEHRHARISILRPRYGEMRSEERRVGKECRCGRSRWDE